MNPGCGDIVPRIEIARPLHMDSVAGSWRLHLKKTDLPDAAPCVYVVDEEGRLRGSVPLVRLALADPAVRPEGDTRAGGLSPRPRYAGPHCAALHGRWRVGRTVPSSISRGGATGELSFASLCS